MEVFYEMRQHRGGTNRLAVLAQGAHLVLFINDQFVAAIDDNNLKSGGIGVAFDVVAGEESVFEFDNAEVRVPVVTPTSTPTAAPTLTPTATPNLTVPTEPITAQQAFENSEVS